MNQPERSPRDIEEYIRAEDDVAASNGQPLKTDADMVIAVTCIYLRPATVFRCWIWSLFLSLGWSKIGHKIGVSNFSQTDP